MTEEKPKSDIIKVREGYEIVLPDNALEYLKVEEGDHIRFVDLGDGKFAISKVD